MEAQHGPPHPHMERLHQRQPDAHMGPPRQLHMERQHPHEPTARMLPNSAPTLPFPPGMGDLLKQRLSMTNAGVSCSCCRLKVLQLQCTALGHLFHVLCGAFHLV